MLIPIRSLGLVLLVGLAASCTQQTPLAPGCRTFDRSGAVGDTTTPPNHCFFFPSGMAMDPLGDVLYVGNTNGDLSFGGGTVVAVDVLRYERAVACTRKARGEAISVDCSQVKTCPALQPSDPIETVDSVAPPTDPNYDPCFCETDLTDPNVVNCESHRFILRDQTVRVGNFSGPVRLLASDPGDWNLVTSSTELHRTLYVPVRGDPSLTYIDVTRKPGDLATAAPRVATTAPAVRLRCGVDRPAGAKVTDCDDAHRVQHQDLPAIPNPTDSNPRSLLRFALPPAPFQVTLDRGCKPGYIQLLTPGRLPVRGKLCQKPNPDPNKTGTVDAPEGNYGYLLVTHLAGGEISGFTIPDPTTGQPVLRTLLPEPNTPQVGLFPGSSNGLHGTYDLAPRVPGDLTQAWYGTSRLSGLIATFRVSPAGSMNGPLVVPGLSFNLSAAYAGTGGDVRQVLFEPGGARAFLAVNNPPSVAVVDTRLDLGSTPANLVTNVIDICPGSSRMLLSRGKAEQNGALVKTSRLYIACYDASQIGVVDPDTGDLVGTIQLGRGPTTQVLNYGGEPDGGVIDPCADPFVGTQEAGLRGVTCPAANGLRVRLGATDLSPRMYVTSYLDNAVAVIDLDPRSPTFQRLVSRIGLPLPKLVQ